MRYRLYKLLCIIGLILAMTAAPAHAEVTMQEPTYEIVIDTMTDKEFDELCRVMFLECRGEPFEGKVAVAEVILNRVISEDWPDTVHDVLSQRGQFSTWHHIAKAYNVKESDIAVSQGEINRAIMYVHDNGRTVLPNDNYVYFDTRGVNGRNHVQIGNHYFGEGR